MILKFIEKYKREVTLIGVFLLGMIFTNIYLSRWKINTEEVVNQAVTAQRTRDSLYNIIQANDVRIEILNDSIQKIDFEYKRLLRERDLLNERQYITFNDSDVIGMEKFFTDRYDNSKTVSTNSTTSHSGIAGIRLFERAQ